MKNGISANFGLPPQSNGSSLPEVELPPPPDTQKVALAPAAALLPVADAVLVLGFVTLGVVGYLAGNPKAISEMTTQLGALLKWNVEQCHKAQAFLTRLLESGQQNAQQIASSVMSYMQSLAQPSPATPINPPALPATPPPPTSARQKVVPSTSANNPPVPTQTRPLQNDAAAERLSQQQANAARLREDMRLYLSSPVRSSADLVTNWNSLSSWYRSNTASADRPDLPAGVSLTSILKEGQTDLLKRRAASIAATFNTLKPGDPQLLGKLRYIESQIRGFESFMADKRLQQDIQAVAKVDSLRGMLHRAQVDAAGGDEPSQPQKTPAASGAPEATTPSGPDGAEEPTGPPKPQGSGSGEPKPKIADDWTKKTANIVEGTSTAFTVFGLEYMAAKAALGEVRVFNDSVPMAGGKKLDMPKLVNEFSDANSLGPQGTLTLATVKPGTNEADGHVFVVLNASILGSKVFKLDDIRKDLLDPKKGPGHVVSHLTDYVDWNKINVIAQALPDKGQTGVGARAILGGLGNITATVVTGTPEFGNMQKFVIQLGMANGGVRAMGANTSVTALNKKTGNMETVNSGNLLGQAYVLAYGSDVRDPNTALSVQSGLRFGPSSIYVIRVKPAKFEANAWGSTEADPGQGRFSIDLSKTDPKDTRALTLAFNGNKYTELFDKLQTNPDLVKWDKVGDLATGKIGIEEVVDPSLLKDYGGAALKDAIVLGRDFLDTQSRVVEKGVGALVGADSKPPPINSANDGYVDRARLNYTRHLFFGASVWQLAVDSGGLNHGHDAISLANRVNEVLHQSKALPMEQTVNGFEQACALLQTVWQKSSPAEKEEIVAKLANRIDVNFGIAEIDQANHALNPELTPKQTTYRGLFLKYR